MVNARDCTLRAEWQCRPRGAARSGPSGSAPYTATRRRAYQDGALGPEWQCRPRGAARSGPSSSAPHTATRRRTYGLHALTLPLDVERTGCTPSHCHSTSSVPRRRARARVAVPTTRGCTLRPEWQCGFGWPTSQQSLRRCQGAPPGRVSSEWVSSLVRDGPFAGSGTSSCKAGRDGCAAGQPDVVSLPQGGTAAPHCTTPPC